MTSYPHIYTTEGEDEIHYSGQTAHTAGKKKNQHCSQSQRTGLSPPESGIPGKMQDLLMKERKSTRKKEVPKKDVLPAASDAGRVLWNKDKSSRVYQGT